MKYTLSVLFLFSCLQGMAITTPKTKLRILDGNNIEPYAIQGLGQNKSFGVQPELFDAIFADSEFEVDFSLVPLARVDGDIETLKADGATRMNRTDIAGYRSKEAYIQYGDCVITLTKKKKIKSLEQLTSMTIVGFLTASTTFNNEFGATLKKTPKYTELNDQTKQVMMLLSEEADAIVADLQIARYKASLLGTQKNIIKCNMDLHSPPHHAFFKNKSAADAFDKGLVRIRKNGQHTKILKKYGIKNNLVSAAK